MSTSSLGDVVGHVSGSLCILAGAGISYPPPASLPTALHVLRELLSSLPIPRSDRDVLLDALSPEWEGGLGYFDFLRFEQVIEALQYCGDAHIPLIQSIVPRTRPNAYHYQLARLLAAGHRILTTNFDCLIEHACEDLGIPYTLLVSNRDYDEYLAEPSIFTNPIFKLHGTILSSGAEGSSPAATHQAVTSERNQAVSKWAAVDDLLTSRDLMVIGYSGSDDFDVMPSIRFAPRRLLWVQHGEIDTLATWRVSEEQAPDDLGIDQKLHWFLSRMFGAFTYVGRVKRNREDVLVTRTRTGRIIAEILGYQEPIERECFDQPGDTSTSRATIARVFDSESPSSLLFVGSLFRYIGLFERSLAYLERAVSQCGSSGERRVASRAHASIARIWLERDRWDKAMVPMAKTLERQKELSTLDWIDALDAAEFSHRLGIGAANDQELAIFKHARDWLTPRQVTQLRRAVHLWEGERLLKRRSHTKALQRMIARHEEDAFPFEIWEEAESLLLFLKIQRAYNWELVQLGERADAAWELEEATKYQLRLQEASTTFETFQQRAAWADSILFEAEEFLWSVAPDWSEEAARVAARIYFKIGHLKGYARCVALVVHLRRIASGEASATNYRPIEIVEADEAEAADCDTMFCPRCCAMRGIELGHCVECGWLAEMARKSEVDESVSSGERSLRRHEIFVRAGRSVLNPTKSDS